MLLLCLTLLLCHEDLQFKNILIHLKSNTFYLTYSKKAIDCILSAQYQTV